MNKDIKKEDFKKISNEFLTERNHRINMTSEHSISSNEWFNSHLNAQSFHIFLTLRKLCQVRSFYFSVCWKVDVNSALRENSKKPSASTISTEASFNNDSNEKTLNVNKIYQ